MLHLDALADQMGRHLPPKGRKKRAATSSSGLARSLATVGADVTLAAAAHQP